MKYLIRIFLIVFAAGFALTACDKNDHVTSFGLDTEQITIGAEGGIETVRVESSGNWVASTEAAWLAITPANGIGTMDCKISVDTTLLADDVRRGTVKFINNNNEERLLQVIQTGYEKMVVLSLTEQSVANYAAAADRVFEVDVTANVEFVISKNDDASWIKNEDFTFELDRGARPRTVTLKFKWDSNTVPEERTAIFNFNAESGEELSRSDILTVIQQAAEEIVPGTRRGDSLAIIACARAMNYSIGSRNEGENMNNWTFVEMWSKTDENYVDSLEGRVRLLKFQSFKTADGEGIPFEIQYLTGLETLSFYGNGNAFLRDFSSGEYIAKLTQLKHLELGSFGLSSLDDSFGELVNLETLELSGNNFNEVPGVLLDLNNFPNLESLGLMANVRYNVSDFNTTTRDVDEWGGLHADGAFPTALFQREKLTYMRLSNNYIWGTIPDFDDAQYNAYFPRWAAGDTFMYYDTNGNEVIETVPAGLVGKAKVLPNAQTFSLNLNMLYGSVPDWILYHPHLVDWDPETLVFTQRESIPLSGITPGFDNVPATYDYYYDDAWYPYRRR